MTAVEKVYTCQWCKSTFKSTEHDYEGKYSTLYTFDGQPPVYLITCKACDVTVYECKYCKKTFDDDSHSTRLGYSTIGDGGKKIVYVACETCQDKKYCKVCRKIFVSKGGRVRKCEDCCDIAAKFWSKTMPGDVVPGFAIDITVKTTTCIYCTEDGKPVAIKTDSRVWIPDGSAICQPEEKIVTLRFPIHTSLDPMFFDDFEMSWRFKELFKDREDRPLPGCKCQKAWSDGCRRVYEILDYKLIQLVTPKQQIFQFSKQ